MSSFQSTENQPLLYPRRRSTSVTFSTPEVGIPIPGARQDQPSGGGGAAAMSAGTYQPLPGSSLDSPSHILSFPASINSIPDHLLGPVSPNLVRSKTYAGHTRAGASSYHPALVERPTSHHMQRASSGSNIDLDEPRTSSFARQTAMLDEIEDMHLDWDPDFDTSAAHLMKLFNTLDKDKDGRLTYDELREGLMSMRGMHEIPAVKINQIIQAIDTDHSHDITQEEFVYAFQHLATKGWKSSLVNLLEFFVYDYGPDMAICRWIYSKGQGDTVADEAQLDASLDQFFHEPVDDVKPGNVRWVSITGVDAALIVRLANKYNLRMLQVEDVLGTDKERMKVDIGSNGRMQIVVGRCTVVEPMLGCPQIKKEQVTVFLIGDHTVLSIQRTPSQINGLLLARIMYAGSKIRLNGPKFLAYSIIDSIVDELFPILRLLRKRLKAMHSDVTSMNKTSLATVHLIQHLIREIKLLGLWLSPLSAVASRLIAELPTLSTSTSSTPNNRGAEMAAADTELKRHLDDLQDHIQALKEQTASMVGWAQSLNEEYLNEQSHRMNQVIYILTMTTTMVLPAQFFTGVFGMNFEHLPLLKDTWGFYYFWGLTITVSITIFMVFRVKNWL